MEASSSSAIAQLFQRDKPNDPCYFKRVKIHSLALLKMVIHARSGGTMEVIGLMQGETDGDCITVRDAIALSVEGTETRVNAQADAQTNKQVPAGRLEDVVGWYHSHPGYGCWLSGIDVSTQMVNQQFQESFLAVVIDPTRTHPDDGEVDLEAFMTYPEDYKPPDDFENQLIPLHIPLNKIRDFDDHCKQYYSLLITYFRSHSDTQLLQPLWENCWREAQSSCLLLQGDYLAGQISALAKHPKALSRFKPPRKKEEESPLTKIPRDSAKQVHVLMSQVIKDTLISSVHQANKSLHIPEAIVEQILFKLSIKVLCKLKVVSKGLYSLISSPEFGHNQFKKSQRSDCMRLIIYMDDDSDIRNPLISDLVTAAQTGQIGNFQLDLLRVPQEYVDYDVFDCHIIINILLRYTKQI